jgi:hypothetical protein
MPKESALIVPIPEVEPIVGQLRLQYDPAARLGVAAHITLLYPFCPPQIISGEIDTLRNVCGSIEAFSFSFNEVRRFPATAYLHPDKSGAFAQIIRTLLGIWTNYQPYGGAFDHIVPHLTVADRVNNAILNMVEDTLRGQLPIQCAAREVWLLTSDEVGMWSKKASFPLGAAKGTTQDAPS